MPWLLDTNCWITLLKRRESGLKIETRIRACNLGQVFLCSVVKGELFHGAEGYENRARRMAVLHEIFAEHPSATYDDMAAETYGRLRHDLEKRGLMIGVLDLMIASIALCHDFTVVTSNTNEFSRVPGLRCENWLD